MFAGDLMNQCVGSTYGLRSFGIPFVGLFGACSTMAESLMTASVFLDSGAGGPGGRMYLVAFLYG